MRRFALVLAVLCLSALVPVVSGDDAKKQKVPREKLDPQKVKALMHKKLEHAQKLLEALTMNDLDKTAKNGADLLQVSKEAEFVVFKTRDYEMYRDEFRRGAETLIQQAKDKNLEGAKLAYLGMTLTCFHCHAYVRDVGMAKFEEPDAGR